MVHFLPTEIREWKGRYRRIAGNTSSLHVRGSEGRKSIILDWNVDNYKYECKAQNYPEIEDLIRAIITTKVALGGSGGGSFVINEFGQVIVPASDGSGRRAICGTIAGTILYNNQKKAGSTIDLSEDEHLTLGDAWDRPFLGVPFNLSGNNRIYFKNQVPNGEIVMYPNDQDTELIRNLRKVRPAGGIRFIVNPYGIALTKKPSLDGFSWNPIYIGRINRETWYQMED